MKYAKKFDIAKTRVPASARTTSRTGYGDRRDGAVYLYTEEIELTVNVALATGRPVFLRGPSGSGKSSLARNVALRTKRRYYEEVITSGTQHTDLLYRFDLLRRFRDSQEKQGTGLKHDANYIEPRALWWAFDRSSAIRRGLQAGRRPELPAVDPSQIDGRDSVVLIDEIDKADPDVPNNLLVALGSLRFSIPHLNNTQVETKVPPLVFITSNDERELPLAFLRRCIVLALKSPEPARMVEIAQEHYGKEKARVRLYEAIAALAFPAGGEALDRTPSTAEYLDAVRTCIELNISPSDQDPVWQTVARATLAKPASHSTDPVAR